MKKNYITNRKHSAWAKTMLLGAVLLLTSNFQSLAQLIYGLSGNNLIVFNGSNPANVLGINAITGITAGQTISGLDFRPATGELYALGYNSANGQSQLYTINRSTAVATAINATPVVLVLGTGKIAFDFNPTVDRIRVVGSNNANYRLHPVTGVIAATDVNLAFAAGDPNQGTDPSIGTVAYTNSYVGATSTTLYDYDDSLNVLTTQNPPNNGTLNTVGSSGIVVNLTDPSSDLDITFDVPSLTNMAYMAANTGVSLSDNLYSINLTTGAASNLGVIGSGLSIQDIAVFIKRTIPAKVTGQLLYALSSNNTLISFDSDRPDIIRLAAAVTGVTAGQTLSGLDFRPATGQLYALGYNSTNGESQLYTINTTTGAAIVINATPTVLALGAGKIGFDFNPTVDRIRVVGSNNANYRLHPVTGAIAATDVNLAYAVGDPNQGTDPSIGAVAYTNSYIGATATTLYDYDDSLNVLTTQNPPNNGTLNTIGSSGITVNLADPSSDLDVAFDIPTLTNMAFMVANTGSGVNDNLYTINLTTGVATNQGMIGYGIAVKDVAAFIKRTIPAQVTGQLLYALSSNNTLLSFDSDRPDIIRLAVAVTGVTAGQSLSGLDFRPASGELYALGYNSTNGESQLYTINATTGAATIINVTPVVLALGTGKIGFDFNPTVDRIRVVGSNNANYRLHPVTGAIAATDVHLAYAVGDPNQGTDPSIGAVAYTNSYIGATATTLYDYDDSLNVLTTQNPPNNGTLNTLGSSGITVNLADPSSDLDVAFDVPTFTNIAYLVANTSTSVNDNLYSINLITGSATNKGLIGYGIAVKDVAAFLKRTIPANVTGQLVYALTSNNTLISFDSDQPQKIRSAIPVTGVTAGQVLAGLDFRPATGDLYALGYNSTNGESQLYTINRLTSVATAVNATPFILSLGTGEIGMDFNPVADRVRVVGANNANYRLNPITGTLAATDSNLNYAAGDPSFGADPSIGTVAYTNSFSGTTTTTLYDYDFALDIIATQNPPNNGTLNTVGSSGIVVNKIDPSADLDIYYNTNTATNIAYLSANTGSDAIDKLYMVDLSTGSTILVDRIGYGIAVRDIAVFGSGSASRNDFETISYDHTAKAFLSVFPNPVSTVSRVRFEVEQESQVRLVITDMSGRTIGTMMDKSLLPGVYDTALNLSSFNPGIYLLNMYSDNNLVEAMKIISQ